MAAGDAHEIAAPFDRGVVGLLGGAGEETEIIVATAAAAET